MDPEEKKHKRFEALDLLGLTPGQKKSLRRRLQRIPLVWIVAPCSLLLLTIVWLVVIRKPSTTHCPASALGSQLAQISPYKGPAADFEDRYTVLLNSYQRQDLLKKAIARLAVCPQIDAIRVVWCEAGLPPGKQKDPSFYSEQKEVRYDVFPSSSFNNRFYPMDGIRTEAVLSLDDDLIIPCGDLDRAFKVWQHNKRNLVGFYPRLHVQRSDCRYDYMQGTGTLMWHGEYSIILTKAAFLHRDYLEAYSNQMHAGIRSYVEAARNCEDLAMQFLVANATGLPPVFVHSSSIIDMGKGVFKVKGISSTNQHVTTRSDCLEEFAKHYGGMPLVTKSLSDQPNAWTLRISPLLDTIRASFSSHTK